MKRAFAIVIMCCAFALAMGLAGCGGSSSGSAAGGSAGASSSDDAAAKQAAEAQAALDEGLEYWYGTGAAGYDRNKAKALFQKAADAGNADAWYYLGMVAAAESGEGCYDEMLADFEKAAEAGSALGLFGQGEAYEFGRGVEPDYAKAKSLYEQALGEGLVGANVGLGHLYYFGHGTEADGKAAIECFEKAAAADELLFRGRALLATGNVYKDGADGVEQDYAKANEYFQRAIDAGYAPAYANMGGLYRDGFGVEQDYAKALEYFEVGDARGDSAYLGDMYRNGHGVEQDYARALEIYEKSTRESVVYTLANGNAGYSWVAYMYANGYGVEQDLGKARELYEHALYLGDKRGASALEKLEQRF